MQILDSWCAALCSTVWVRERERERDRQTDRQTDRHMERGEGLIMMLMVRVITIMVMMMMPADVNHGPSCRSVQGDLRMREHRDSGKEVWLIT